MIFATFQTSPFLPSQYVLSPLQFPFDIHCLTLEPRRMKPSSQINFITCGYVVRFPDKEPLVGALSAPQSFAGDTKEKAEKEI